MRKLLLPVLLGGMVLSLYFFLRPLLLDSGTDRPRDPDKPPAKTIAAAKSSPEAATRSFPSARGREQSRAHAFHATPLYKEYFTAERYGELYQKLGRLGEADPEARYLQGLVLKSCTMFSGQFYERLEKLIGQQTPNPKRAAIARAQRDKCLGVNPEAATVGAGDLIAQAAAQGDPKARAYMFNATGIRFGEQSLIDSRDARELALSRNPAVINQLDGYFHRRHNVLVWTIPGVNEPVSGREMALGFTLAACSLGYECSESGPDYQVMCALRGWCDDGGREAQLRNNTASPAQLRRAEAVRDTLLAGLTSGQWPPGFWSGSNGSIPTKKHASQ